MPASIPARLLSCAAVAGTLALAAPAMARAAAPAPADDVVTVALRPAAEDAAHRIGQLQVTLTEPVGTTLPGQPLLRLPKVTSNVATSAETLQGLAARDADGPLPLAFRDDPAGPKPYRRWTASRPVHGPVQLSYRVPIGDAPNPLGAAPPFELRSEDAVFSGLAGSFVILPDSERRYRLSLHWDLAALGGDTLGVSTLGTGDRVAAEAQPSEQLESVFVMGGRLAHEPAQPAPDGFFSAWQGAPPFDARALMQWTHRLYGYYLGFFQARHAAYSVYLRRNPINPGGGVEVQNSFVGTFDAHTPVDEFKLTLAHEMVHTFVGALDAEDTAQELRQSWFAEGLAVYYQRLLPLRAGLIDRAAYLKDVNATAARYYTDLLNTTPNERIPARFWPDTRVRVLPYDRGALYFAQLNAEIAAASGGRRSLDDLVRAFLRRRAAGQPLTRQAWVEAVVQAVGERGRRQFEAMMKGEPIVLATDAFGPCFRRTRVPLRRYELGFTPDVLIEPGRVVRGLVPGSAAALAGLRDGDAILRPVPQDGIQGDQHATLTLHVRRGDRVMDITYLPRGETVPAYQWVASGAAACRAG